LKSGAPSTLVSNDKVLIVAPAYGIYWRLDGDRIFDLYADALSTYGGFTRENIDIFYTQELFHGGDSAFVADSIIHSPAKYVIVFGRVEDKNYGCPWITEPPLPWIHDPAYETFWHDDHALSLADWEVHAPDGSIEKSIGFVPIRFNYYGSLDLVNYYYKMLAYWENGPEGYERRLGAWTEDEDGIVGAVAVRLSMESLLDKVHPYWDVRDLWDSKIGGGALTYQDSVSEALLDGRSVALMLATLSGPSFPALAIRKSSTTLYDSLEDSGNLTHLVPMSCQAHEIDYANANGTPDTGYVSVVEKLLWVPNGGAITSIGPTRAFYQWYYVRYLSEYINQLNNASGPVRVGDLHRSIRESLFASTPSDTMRMFCKTVVLLGDPTLPVYGMFWNPVSGLALASGDGAPKNELLGPVRPNPFNASATVGVTMPNTSVAQLSVYDVMGRLVKTLVSGELAEGEHQLLWDGRSSSGGELPSGIYFLRLVTDGACETGKLTLVK
jgi:hypothetical protein